MKILFNVTTPRKGGALQRAVSFLGEMMRDPMGHEWHVATSDVVLRELAQLKGCVPPDLQVYESSPARSLAARRRLQRFELQLRPDCVITLSGPAYVRFRARHLLGCSDGWSTHSTWTAYRTLSFPTEWGFIALNVLYKLIWLRHADGWVVQTETARLGLNRRLSLPVSKVSVIPNSCAAAYTLRDAHRPLLPNTDRFRILCFAAPYRHKRIELVPRVARALLDAEARLNFEFVLTLPECRLLKEVNRIARRLGVEKHIHNVGAIPVAEAPRLYKSCQLCFIPTVLETFSATYVEAMAMHVPIVASDFGFARDTCGTAARYFRPNHVRDAADKILDVYGDSRLRQELVELGEDRVHTFPSASERYRRYVALAENMLSDRTLAMALGETNAQ